MELIYLYVDGYHNFRGAEFNFSQDVRLRFEKGTIIVTESDEHRRLPEKFWGENISNLSMIVGNNGAGKTGLMQYLIDIFLEAHERILADGRGILILGEGDTLYGYRNEKWGDGPADLYLQSGRYKHAKWLRENNIETILGKTKLIYLTNTLSERDNQRGQWYGSRRFKPFYDCSVGSMVVSDSKKDVNRDLQKEFAGVSELETYFIYEQYKQIKFVFDKRQHRICTELKEQGYPVPVPERLYIELMMHNQMDAVLDDADRSRLGWELDRRIFPDLYEMQNEQNRSEETSGDLEHGEYGYQFLRRQLSRCAVWCAVRSAARLMNEEERLQLYDYLLHWNKRNGNYAGILEELWDAVERMKESGYNKSEDWIALKGCRGCYFEFLEYIASENLEKHFKIETKLLGSFGPDSDRNSMMFSIATEDADWFMEFLQKYRYICNPDYFLDFHWGLSSGENSLLSMFSSLYYIYDADYTNEKNGDYQILNECPRNTYVKCDSVILMMDEAELTYHPEWQRAFIALLTAFLPRVYPPQCCQHIQIVISTHSPILLGDVPQQNVIYLKFDAKSRCTGPDTSEHSGTFGQNIHLLFKDSFFLNHGTLGLFAQGKINGLLKKIKDVEEEFEHAKERQEAYGEREEQWLERLEKECRPGAEVIAEPIIRRKIRMKIDELEKKISQAGQSGRLRQMSDAEIEREISRLRREQDRRRNDKDFIV